MEIIRNLIVSTVEPSVHNTIWAKPLQDGTFSILLFGQQGWTSVSNEEAMFTTKRLSEAGTSKGYMKDDGTIDTSSNALIHKYDISDANISELFISNSTQLPHKSDLCTIWIVDEKEKPIQKFLVDTIGNNLDNFPVSLIKGGTQIWVQSDNTGTFPTVKAKVPIKDALEDIQEKQLQDGMITLYLGDDTAKNAENIKKLDEYKALHNLTNDGVGIPCILNVHGSSQGAGFIQYNVLTTGKSGLIRTFNNASILVFDMDNTGKITQRADEWYIIGPALEAAYGYVKKASKVTPLADSATLADVITSFNSLLTAMGKANLMTV